MLTRQIKLEALLLQRNRATSLLVEILQLYETSHLKKTLQSTNDLEVHTPKVIAIAAFR